MSVMGIEPPWDMQGETLENRPAGSISRSASHATDFDIHGAKLDELARESIAQTMSVFPEERSIAHSPVNYTGDPLYDPLLGRPVRDDQGIDSNLQFSPLDHTFRGEISFAGLLRDAQDEAADDVILAISQNGRIASITKSGRARDRHGYVPFSLPELEPFDAPRELKMFEVTRNEDGTFTLGFVAELDS